MKKWLFIVMGLGLFLNSCKSVNDAEKVADLFHEKLDAHDHDYILDNLIDPVELEEEGVPAWRNFLELVSSWGKIKDREKSTGFKIKTNNGVSTVKLEYTFENDFGTMYEAIVLIDRGEGYKLFVVSMNQDKSEVDAYTKDFD